MKSEGVLGQTEIYQAIVRGRDNFGAGIPEGFHVLAKEPKPLGLNVDLDNQAA